MHIAIMRVVDQRIALEHVTLVIRGQGIEQGRPGTDIAPARIERQHDRIARLFHDRIVDRLAATLRERRLVDAHEIQVAPGGLEGRAHRGEDIGRKGTEFLEIALGREHEHAAVPEIVAGLDELTREIERRLLDELGHREGGS